MNDFCPDCGANLVGEPIPQEHIDKGYYGRNTTHYYRTIGLYDFHKDRTAEWQCPDCGHRWPREGSK